ncbi:MAG: NAD(P)-binding protein [Pseudomonadota bacterium]
MNSLAVEPGSTVAYPTGDWRNQRPVYRDKWPPCGQTCPAEEDIQVWLGLASDRQWEAAWRALTERNPLPAVMGRVCYHPCERACNRTHLDGPVNIHGVERHLGDLALEHGWRHHLLTEQPQTQQVAVVGTGPAGLSCAFQLARRGYPVTLFDARSTPGGTLSSGIPGYRLPKSVLQGEIDAILALGIQLKLNTRIGVEIGADTLREEFAAVFLAVGALQPRTYPDDGYGGHSVMTGVDFLRRINDGERLSLPKHVAVIGGGNTAIDAARCARRLGAEVTVVCPQDPHGSHGGHPGAEMPASLDEVIQAEAEGVRLRYRVGVRRLVRSGAHLSGVEIARVDQIHDRHGRFNPVLFEGTEEFLPAGLAVFAIGQEVDWRGLEALVEPRASSVFIGGDAAGQPRFAATAVGSGYQAAMSIIAFLTGAPSQYRHHDKAEVTFRDIKPQYYPKQVRREGELMVASPGGFSERVAGLDGDAALVEAGRCLSCGVCFACDNCWHFCPDAAVIKQMGGYRIDYDYCKGCGICAAECPCGHIDMEREAG